MFTIQLQILCPERADSEDKKRGHRAEGMGVGKRYRAWRSVDVVSSRHDSDGVFHSSADEASWMGVDTRDTPLHSRPPFWPSSMKKCPVENRARTLASKRW